MTRVRGVRILAAACCGQEYAFAQYASMNFSAFEYWTDGWRVGSLMPNDEGLRRCKCGRFLLTKNLVEVGTAGSSDLPRMDHVADDALGECIANADSEEVEIAARLELWRHLNHPYRERYRRHRDKEDAATKAAWEAANPDRRNWWDKLRGRKAPIYRRSQNSSWTYAPFVPSPEQLQNMQRLTELLISGSTDSACRRQLELAELYREQSRFETAKRVLDGIPEREMSVAGKLINMLIGERQSAPTRYRI